MRTKEFMKLIAEESGQTVVATEKFYDALLKLVDDRILAGEEVVFRNLFTIKPKETQARQVKCGFDGKVHDLPASRGISLKTSSVLKKRLNEN